MSKPISTAAPWTLSRYKNPGEAIFLDSLLYDENPLLPAYPTRFAESNSSILVDGSTGSKYAFHKVGAINFDPLSLSWNVVSIGTILSSPTNETLTILPFVPVFKPGVYTWPNPGHPSHCLIFTSDKISEVKVAFIGKIDLLLSTGCPTLLKIKFLDAIPINVSSFWDLICFSPEALEFIVVVPSSPPSI